MVFSSITFLFLFLPATLVIYHLLPRRARNDLLARVSARRWPTLTTNEPRR